MEKLAFAAIIRNGQLHGTGYTSHSDIRRNLGDPDPYQSNMSDEEGFLTNTGRFVTRDEAKIIGVKSGQLSESWINSGGRNLISSAITW